MLIPGVIALSSRSVMWVIVAAGAVVGVTNVGNDVNARGCNAM